MPGALVNAFSYDDRVLLERHVAGRDLACSIVECPTAEAASRSSRRVPAEEDFYDFEARYEIGRTRFVCPAELPAEVTARASGDRARRLPSCSGCYGFARVDLMLEEPTGELYVLEANAIPGLTETSLLPQAADAAGLGFDQLVARVLELAFERVAPRGRARLSRLAGRSAAGEVLRRDVVEEVLELLDDLLLVLDLVLELDR